MQSEFTPYRCRATEEKDAPARGREWAAWIDDTRESQREEPLTVSELLRQVLHLDAGFSGAPRGWRTLIRQGLAEGVRAHRREERNMRRLRRVGAPRTHECWGAR